LDRWLFVPRSVAAFYVPKRNQHLIRSTLPTSHGFVPKEREGAARAIYDPMPSSGEKNAMIKQFEYFGTIDNAPYLCILPALKFRDEVCGGEEKIRKYCTSLAAKAEKRLAEILGTETMEVADEKRCFFAHAKLPLTIGEEGDVKTKDVAQVTEFMNTEFVNTYQTYIYILYYDGAWWARLSITIYLDLEDCEYGGKVLKELCERVKRKEHLTN
jgi:hercynylcysteine S-oxide lyase